MHYVWFVRLLLYLFDQYLNHYLNVCVHTYVYNYIFSYSKDLFHIIGYSILEETINKWKILCKFSKYFTIFYSIYRSDNNGQIEKNLDLAILIFWFFIFINSFSANLYPVWMVAYSQYGKTVATWCTVCIITVGGNCKDSKDYLLSL